MMARTGRAVPAKVVTGVLVALVAGGCAMKGDVRDLQDEIRQLAIRQDSLLAELRAETRSTQDTLRTQTDQMFDFRGDINQAIRAIQQSLARLEALAGENQRGITGVRDQLASQRRAAAQAPPLTMMDSVGGSPGGSEQIVGGGTGNADQLWQVAFDQMDRRSLSSATAAFQQFIADFPDDERVPDAHFYLADILTQQDRPQDAILAFQEIATRFPASAVVPDAMYRVAELQRDLGQTEEAKATLERIVNTYPGSRIAMIARDLLEDIG